MSQSIKIALLQQRFNAIVPWIGRFLAVSIIGYSVAYSVVMAPKRFSVVRMASDYPMTMTIRQISSLKTNMIPLELPPDENSLVESLHLQSDQQLRNAQLRLYRRALDWDNWFLVLYPLQLFSVLLLIWKDLDPQRSVLARSLVGMTAALAIAATGIFDHRENLHLARILDSALAWKASDLSFFADERQSIVLASTSKWAAWAASCFLLVVLSRWITGNSWLRRPGWLLAASGLLAVFGIIPRWHGLLSLSVILYGIVPLIITWRLILLPPVEWVDKKAGALVRRLWRGLPIRKPVELTLDNIYGGELHKKKYRTWSAVGPMPWKSHPAVRTTPKSHRTGDETSTDEPTNSE